MSNSQTPKFSQSDHDFLVDQLLALPTRAAQRRCLAGVLKSLTEQQVNAMAEALKERVVQGLWGDISAAVQIADLILVLARLTQSKLHRALGLRAKAQALSIGLGEHRKALRLYNQALAIYRENDDRLGQAMVYLTGIWAMACVGMHQRAVEAGEWSSQVLEEYQQWRAYATLQNNMATIYNHSWQFQNALNCNEEANRVYRQMGEAGVPFLANNEINRAMALCNLGRFQESLIASQSALELAQAQKIVYARAQHNMAITYFLMGRYNQALELLIQAGIAHRDAGQANEAALCELTATDCLLELNRTEAALEKCQALMPIFTQLGMRLEMAETAHHQAVVYMRLNRGPEAVNALATVRDLFEAEQMPHWSARTDLEIAQAHLQNGNPELALPVARQSTTTLQSLGLPFETLQAQMVVAQSLLELGCQAEARQLLEETLSVVIASDWPALAFQLHRLLARVQLAEGQKQRALEAYEKSVQALEGLRSQVMLEYRASFLLEREAVYREVVALCLDLEEPDRALEFAERARSRAMLELLSGHADLSLRARQPADLPLLDQIHTLQAERQQCVRRLDSLTLELAPRVEEESAQLRQRVSRLEKEITESWHTLIIRNDAYAQDAVLWAPQPDGLDIRLEPGTLFLEYFTLDRDMVLFIVHPAGDGIPQHIETIRLPGALAYVEQLIQLLQLNFQSIPVSPEQARGFLEKNARGLLNRLYNILLAPAGAAIAGYHQLVIVPHGPLHYLPFHALYDGQHYLIETHTLRYLPTAALLDGPGEPAGASQRMLAIGHSFQGRLPYTLQEARSVAGLWAGELLLEQDATLERLRADCSNYRLIHLACHGDFRPDNPLFSGLALEEGWLTTLDIFNLRLNASLVTLSACQTGRGVIGGGDELAGLMRALLSAGAASLVLSQWAVSDQSTARLMALFYQALANGEAKAAALRTAQLGLLKSEDSGCRHPYFWAPFFLVGKDGIL